VQYFYNFEKVAYLKGERPDGCILCMIRDHSDLVENLTVFENELFNVSLNLYPYNPGHVIIFPLRHIEDLRSFTEAEAQDYIKILNTTLDVIERVYSPSGVNYGCNMGLDAGASIAHLHFHVIPRFPRETGIADLIAGQRVLVENPVDTLKKLTKAFGAD
jgi:ATP adenylyltransferase